jgi:hypothetical protein
MKPNEIHENIAEQIANMMPDHLRRGTDVTMAPLDRTTLLVKVMPAEPMHDLSRDVQISYDEGGDWYDVVVLRHGERTEYGCMYCDQLGVLTFGPEAKPFSLPMMMIRDGKKWRAIA